MSSDAETQSEFKALHTGLRLLRELEQEADASPRLEQARIHLAEAGRQVGTAGFESRFSKAMGMVSSIAVANGHDDLAEDALELGSDQA